jgi:DNA-binding transcriptional LysR family regulator
VDLRQIDCFLEVARELHFGRAAQNLFLSQSSVSESIKSLEREVGGPLFERTSRRVALTPLGASFRLGAEPAAFAMRTTLDECRRQARGEVHVLRVGFFGGGLYELTLPFMARLKALVPRLDVEWVELTIVDQFQAVADGRVDAAVCRLPLGRDELVAGSELFVDRRKLVVPVDHRLAEAGLVDPEELADEVLPVVPADQQLSAWAAFHFPRLTPKGHSIGRGPIVRTVRECMAAVETGSAVIIMGARSEAYYAHPGVRYLDLDLPPVPTALVWKRSDTRQAIIDLEACARGVASERTIDMDAPAVGGVYQLAAAESYGC